MSDQPFDRRQATVYRTPDGLPQPRTGDKFTHGTHEYIITRPGRYDCRMARVEHDGSFGRIEVMGRQYVRQCLAGGRERA